MKQAPPTNSAGMKDAVDVCRETRAEISGLPSAFRRVDRHVNHNRSADNVLPRDAAPVTRVERILTIVSHGEITMGRDSVWKHFGPVLKLSAVLIRIPGIGPAPRKA